MQNGTYFSCNVLYNKSRIFNFYQQLENVQASLELLAKLGVAVEGMTARDIREGNLKAVLSLFFALSR